MMIKESVRMSMKAVTDNKMRSFLTMLGIIIGVMSLVVLVSLANGTSSSVSDSISAMGTNTLTVQISDDKDQPLSIDGLDELVSDLDEVEAVSPSANSTATAESEYSKSFSEDEASASASVTGTGSRYADIMGLTLEAGRYFNVTDLKNHTNVVVISSDLAEDIMGNTDCVGEEIELNGLYYEIIGVTESSDSTQSAGRKGSSSSYRDYQIYMPYTSLVRFSDSVSSEITTFIASATSDETIDQAERELELALLARLDNDSDAFTIQNQSDVADTMADVQSSMKMMLGGIAAISLLVGGIGIMNIMLVSVTERTREIGIRKAIGAGRGSIMTQFLIEALILSLMGCALGIFGSFAAIRIIDIVGNTTYTLSMNVVWISIIFSSLIGVLFGMYPANRAAKKNPIEALRYVG